MASAEPTFSTGQVIPGTKYRVLRWLGAGAMGVVYQVEKPPNIRGVLKLMNTELTKHEQLRLRFFDEVRVIAELEHPNIVRVFDYDALPDGTPFYVMEHLTGQTVGEVLEAVDRFPPTVAYEITRQLLEALHCAHTNRIQVIHRDIKPDNIFLHVPRHGEPVVKLIDFGVSAISDRQQTRGVFAGTPSYASPEQIAGEAVTPASDLYSVALVLYEMLTGRGPFVRHATPEAVMKAQREEVPPSVSNWVRGIPPSIVKLIDEALAKDPSKRPRDAYAFSERLYDLQWSSAGVDPRSATYEGLGDAPTARPPAEGSLSGVLSTYAAVKAAHPESDPHAGLTPASLPSVEVRAETPPSAPVAASRDRFSSHHSDTLTIAPRPAPRGRRAIGAAALVLAAFGVIVLWLGRPPRPASAVTASVAAATSPARPQPSPPSPSATASAESSAAPPEDAPKPPKVPINLRPAVRARPSASALSSSKRPDYMPF